MATFSRRIFLQSLLGSITLPAFGNSKAKRQSIRFAHHENLLPYTFRVEGRTVGKMVSRLNDVLDQADYNATHQGYPWKRAQTYVFKGALDAICTNKTREGEKHLFFNEIPLFESPVGILHRQNDEQIQNIRVIEDLHDINLVDYIGNDWAVENLSSFDISLVHKQDQILHMIELGRAQGSIGCVKNLTELLNHSTSLGEDLTVTTLPFLKDYAFYLGLRKTLPDAKIILKKVDDVLSKMQTE